MKIKYDKYSNNKLDICLLLLNFKNSVNVRFLFRYKSFHNAFSEHPFGHSKFCQQEEQDGDFMKGFK